MATPQPPSSSSPSSSNGTANPNAAVYHNLALGLLVVCPIVALLPPRKLNFTTSGLAGAWLLSANHLYHERARRNVVSLPSSTVADGLPTERAREVHRLLKEGRDQSREGTGGKEEDKKGLAEKIWMGEEKEGWKERRVAEDRRKFEEGKGYGDIIMDQIWDVVTWNKANDKEKHGNSKGNQSG